MFRGEGFSKEQSEWAKYFFTSLLSCLVLSLHERIVLLFTIFWLFQYINILIDSLLLSLMSNILWTYNWNNSICVFLILKEVNHFKNHISNYLLVKTLFVSVKPQEHWWYASKVEANSHLTPYHSGCWEISVANKV